MLETEDSERIIPHSGLNEPRGPAGETDSRASNYNSVMGTMTGEIQALGGSHADRLWPSCRGTSQKGSAQEGSTYPKSSIPISEVWRSPEKAPVYQEINNPSRGLPSI